MAKTRRAYKGAPVSTTTTSPIASSGTTTFGISDYTGWPYGADPYSVVVEPGTANEEKILVVRAGATDTTVSIFSTPSVAANRGYDDTTAVAHNSGATVYPVFTATDADEANELASTLTTKGDIMVHDATSFARRSIGSDDQVLIADAAQSTGMKWGSVDTAQLAAGAVETATIADGNVTTVKLADDAVTSAKLAAGAVDTTELADAAVETAKIADNAVTLAKIDSSYTETLPGGVKYYAKRTTDLELSGTEANVFSSNVTMESDRLYKISASGRFDGSNVRYEHSSNPDTNLDSSQYRLHIYVAGSEIGMGGTQVFADSVEEQVTIFAYTTGNSGSVNVTIKASAAGSETGSLLCTASRPAYVIVEDIGAA